MSAHDDFRTAARSGQQGWSTQHSFPIAMPVLSRGSADRSEDLRDDARTSAAWPTARVIWVGQDGRTAVVRTAEKVALLHRPAIDFGAVPPAGAVLLGTVTSERSEPVDYWAAPDEDADHAARGGDCADGAEPAGLRDVGGLLSDTDAGLLTAAVAVLTWHRHGSFCPRCGEHSVAQAAGWSRLCPNGHQEFPRTDPAVIMLVHDGADRMVLARQPSWPAGRVSVLAGFTEAGESLEGTVTREVLEEVGLHVTDIGYLGSQPWPFPRSLMVGFAARAEPGAPLYPRAQEIESARWVDRATVRRVLAAGGTSEGISLPPSISIARRMVEGWVALS